MQSHTQSNKIPSIPYNLTWPHEAHIGTPQAEPRHTQTHSYRVTPTLTHFPRHTLNYPHSYTKDSLTHTHTCTFNNTAAHRDTMHGPPAYRVLRSHTESSQPRPQDRLPDARHRPPLPLPPLPRKENPFSTPSPLHCLGAPCPGLETRCPPALPGPALGLRPGNTHPQPPASPGLEPSPHQPLLFSQRGRSQGHRQALARLPRARLSLQSPLPRAAVSFAPVAGLGGPAGRDAVLAWGWGWGRSC